MSKKISRQDLEQLILGDILAIIIDKKLDFLPDELEDELDEMIGQVMTGLYQIGEEVEVLLIEYGILEEGEI